MDSRLHAIDTRAQACPGGRMSEDASRRRLFETEVERLMDRLFGTALRLTRDRTDAEDLVAETVAKAWAKLDELRDTHRFEVWIQRILSNAFVSQWRQRRCRPEVALDEEEDGDDGEGFSLFEKLHQPFLLWWANPEHTLINKLLREDLDSALDSLPDVYRVVVVLVDVQGCTYPEAADLLHVPIGTVRSRLSRARGLLQRALWEQACEAGLVPAHRHRKAND